MGICFEVGMPMACQLFRKPLYRVQPKGRQQGRGLAPFGGSA